MPLFVAIMPDMDIRFEGEFGGGEGEGGGPRAPSMPRRTWPVRRMTCREMRAPAVLQEHSRVSRREMRPGRHGLKL